MAYCYRGGCHHQCCVVVEQLTLHWAFSDTPQQGVGREAHCYPVEMKVSTPYLAFSDNTLGSYPITAGWRRKSGLPTYHHTGMSRDNTAEVFFFSWYLSGVGQLLGKCFQNRCSFLLLWLYRTDFCWDFSFWSAPLAFWLSGFFSTKSMVYGAKRKPRELSSVLFLRSEPVCCLLSTFQSLLMFGLYITFQIFQLFLGGGIGKSAYSLSSCKWNIFSFVIWKKWCSNMEKGKRTCQGYL